MIKTNMRKMVLAGLSLAILSGCVNTRAIESNELNTTVGYTSSASNQIANNTQIEVSNFRETRRYGRSTLPTLDNNEAKTALTNVLNSAGFYNSNGDFLLKAKMVDVNASGTGLSQYNRAVVINYKLVDKRSNRVLFNENIRGEGSSKDRAFLGFFGNAYEFSHQSGSAAFEDNFKNLVNLLNQQ